MQTKPKRNRAAPASVITVSQEARPPALKPANVPPATPPALASKSPTLDANGYDSAAYDWVPVLRKPRVDGWSPERQRSFIGYLADTGSVRLAAQHSGLSTSSAYRLRRSPEGRGFAAAWDAAIQQAAHALIDAAFERAVHGSEEPVWNREGRVIGRRFRQSDAMMMFLLRKHFPDRYGDNYRDRAGPAIAATAVAPPPVADVLERLGPVPPADPAATVHPDMLDLAIARADNGKLPPDLIADEPIAEGLGPEFEAALAEAKAAADAEDDDWEEDEWDDEEEEAEDSDDPPYPDGDESDDDADPNTV